MRTQFKFTHRLICTPQYIYTPEYIHTRVFFAHANWTLETYMMAVKMQKQIHARLGTRPIRSSSRLNDSNNVKGNMIFIESQGIQLIDLPLVSRIT